MFGLGFVSPNSMALALQNHPRSTGTASVFLGSSQNFFRAAIAPTVGIGGSHDPLPMGLVMTGLAGSTNVIRCVLTLRQPKAVLLEQASDL